MTKGQKIIASVLVVVAIGLALNLSLDVSGQYPEAMTPVNIMQEQAEALRRIQYALEDQHAPRSSGAGSASNLSGQMRAIQVELRRLGDMLESEHIQTAIQREWVRKRLVRLRQIVEPKFALPPSAYLPKGPGVVGIRPGHPDFVVDDDAAAEAERDRMGKMFDQLRAAEKQEAQDDG